MSALAAPIHVVAQPAAISGGPDDIIAFAGTNVLLSATVTGSPTPVIQWFQGGQALPGETNAELALPSLPLAAAGNYFLIASNYLGAATSRVAHVTVEVPPWPAITGWRTNLVLSHSATLALSNVVVAGACDYRWEKDGAVLPWATGPSLTLFDCRDGDAGRYRVVASNAFGVATSAWCHVQLVPVAVWGTNDAGQMQLTADLTNAVALAAGGRHLLALKADGRVFGWGANDAAQAAVPPGLPEVVALAAGDAHSLALLADGRVAAWGATNAGQASVPVGLTNVIAVAAGGSHSLALRGDGTVVGWGSNQVGQITTPVFPAPVVAIDASKNLSAAYCADGTVVTWGTRSESRPYPDGRPKPMAIAAGESFCLELIGDYELGGTPSAPGRYDYMRPTVLAAGAGHVIVGQREGGIRALYGTSGQQAVPPWLRRPQALYVGDAFDAALIQTAAPVAIRLPARVTGPAGGVLVLTAMQSGNCVWGYRWLQDGAPVPGVTQPYLAINNLSSNHAGLYQVVTMSRSGDATSSVCRVEVLPPALPEILQQPTDIAVPEGQDATLQVEVRLGTPVSFQWQKDGVDLVGERGAKLSLTNVTASLAGDYRVLVSNASGSVFSSVARLQVVPSAPTLVSTPQPQTVGQGVTATFAVGAKGTQPLTYLWRFNSGTIAGGTNAVLALPSVGPSAAGLYDVVVSNRVGAVTSAPVRLEVASVAGWGSATYGQATAPPAASNLVSIATDKDHTVALRADGSVLAWGNNSYGQTTVPASATNVVSVAVADWSSFAVRADGTVVGWGYPSLASHPLVGTLSNVVALASSSSVVLALRADGRVTGWSSSSDSFRLLAVPPELGDAVAIACGAYHAMALRANGTVVSWGSQGARYGIPTSMTQVVAIAAGNRQSLALLANGTVVTAGEQSVASGTNSFTTRVAEPPPAGLHDVVQICTQGEASLALCRDGTVVGWGVPSSTLWQVPPGLTNVTAIAMGPTHALAAIGTPLPRAVPLHIQRSVPAGSGVLLASAAAGAPPLTFAWNGPAGALTPSREPWAWLVDVQAEDAGDHAVTISNTWGNTSGTVVNLAVTPAAPLVTRQPASTRTVVAGTRLVLEAEFLGSAPVRCQWLHAGTNLFDDGRTSGSGSARLEIQPAMAVDEGVYSLALTNALGEASSSNILVRVVQPTLAEAIDSPGLAWSTGGPDPWAWQTGVTHDGFAALQSGILRTAGTNWLETTVTGPVGLAFYWRSISSGPSFGFLVDGEEVATCPWWSDWVEVVYSVPAGDHVLRWQYVLTTDLASPRPVQLDQFRLFTLAEPVITALPASLPVTEGSAALLSAAATGTSPLRYQWMHAGVPVSGGTTNTLRFDPVAAGQAGDYWLVVSNNGGSATSQVAVLSLVPAPAAVVAAGDGVVGTIGLPVSLACRVTGTGPLSLQWERGGQEIPGANAPVLEIPAVSRTDAGQYRLRVVGPQGAQVSSAIRLTVVPVAYWGDTFTGHLEVLETATDVIAVAAGSNQSAFLRSDGSVGMWIYNKSSYYKLFEFERVPGLDGLSGLAATYDGSLLGWTADGTVQRWEAGSPQTPMPPDAVDVVEVVGGITDRLALRADGRIVYWLTQPIGTDPPPANAINVVSVAAGPVWNLALLDDGTLLNWGVLSSPVAPLMEGVVDIAAGFSHGLALLEDGTVRVWGYAPGDPNTKPPDDLTNVVAIAAGGYHSVALQQDGRVVVWGDTAQGQTQVPAGLTNVVGVAAGANHTLALVGDGSPVITVSPVNRRVVWGDEAHLRVMAVGDGPLEYQWQRDDQDIEGATNALLVLTNVPDGRHGPYRCVVRNALGSVVSRAAYVIGRPPVLRFDADALTATQGLPLIRVQGSRGQGPLVLYESADLVQWTPVATNAPGAGVWELELSVPPGGSAFYRAVEWTTP